MRHHADRRATTPTDALPTDPGPIRDRPRFNFGGNTEKTYNGRRPRFTRGTTVTEADGTEAGRGLDLRFMTDGLGETEMAVLYDPASPETAWIRAPRRLFVEGVERYR